MVNYEYSEQRLEGQHSAYVSEGTVHASPSVWRLLEREHEG